MLVAALGDTHQGRAIAAGKLPRYEAYPGGKVTAILELGVIPDGSDDGCGCLGPDAFDCCDTLARLAAAENGIDLFVEDRDAAVKVA